MNFPFFIARRYLFSKKSSQAINIISWISMSGITIGTMALIIVLSVFNGFEGMITSLFNAFNPDIVVSVKTGKTFDLTNIPVDEIKEIPGIYAISEVVEENALVRYGSKQSIVTIKGVDKSYSMVSGVDTMVVDGTFILEHGNRQFAVPGAGIAYQLSLNLNDYTEAINFYMPKRGQVSDIDPSQSFNLESLFPSGVFSVQNENDQKYIFVPVSFARKLLEYTNEVTSIEIALKKDADIDKIKTRLAGLLGSNYFIRDRYEQQYVLYKIMKSEKWAIFAILTFILIIAAFNVIGSLSMLIIEKKKDAGVMRTLGADLWTIKKIFLTEGASISIIGALTGLALGGLVCWAQMEFSIIKIQNTVSMSAMAYPVEMQIFDFGAVLITVFCIGLLAALYPVRHISTEYISESLIKEG